MLANTTEQNQYLVFYFALIFFLTANDINIDHHTLFRNCILENDKPDDKTPSFPQRNISMKDVWMPKLPNQGSF
jgi:hypothetical protein